VTRDPETGSYNLGIYRGMIKGEDRIGCATDVPTQQSRDSMGEGAGG